MMNEQILPIGIDSEVEHVKSEIDRVDALFNVATGPMGYQEVNYHIIDEERNNHTIQQSFPHTSSITEYPKEKISLKSQSSSATYQHTNELFHSEIVNSTKDEFQQNHISNKSMHYNTFNNYDRNARFSLPEIDSSNQQEKKYQTKKINNPLKYIRKESSTFIPKANLTTNLNEEEDQISSVFDQSIIEIPEQCRPKLNDTLRQQAENLLPFYTLNELAEHNDSTDAWICIFDHMYDITSLIKNTQNTRIFQQFIDYAGQDISSLFDEQTNEPRKRIDPQTHQPISLIKNLSVIKTLGQPFWQTKDYLIGQLTKHPRYIRLIHHFSPKHSYLLEIAEEETIGQIAKKFLKYNTHIFSYIWRYNGQILDFNKTLTENGILNEEFFHDKYGWRSDNDNCPTILLYFSDDLTIA